MDREFLAARIAVTKGLIVAYEDAVLALSAANGVQSYTLDTGQSKQVVTRADISSLNAMLDSLYNRLATFEARLNGASLTAGPCW
jgi:hypothetical protein